MADKIKEFWHDQIPGWLPIFISIVGCAFWLGQQQQNIMDRLKTVENQVEKMQQYLYNHPTKSSTDPAFPGISSLQEVPQIAGGTEPHHY